MKKHPLVAWLRGSPPYKFALAHGIGIKTIYAHLKGNVENPPLDVLQAIESGTLGGVTVQQQSDWFARLKDERNGTKPKRLQRARAGS